MATATTARTLVLEEIRRSSTNDGGVGGGGGALCLDDGPCLDEDEMMELMSVVEDELRREEAFVEDAAEDERAYHAREEAYLRDQIAACERSPVQDATDATIFQGAR